MYDLKMRADNDKSSAKVDLGVGIYRNNVGQYQELQVVKKVRYLQALRSRTRAEFGVFAGEEDSGAE
jgi:aspartate aminotransferase